MKSLRFLNNPMVACLLSLLMLCANTAAAEAQDGKIALVIGNANYIHLPQLRTPVNDGEDVALALSTLGFQVIQLIDGTREQMENAFREFDAGLKGGMVGFFYYAGHAFQWHGGTNHLIPIDAAGDSETALDKVTFHLDPIFNSLRDSGVKLGIVVLDACRRPSPAGSGWPETPGLHPPYISNRINLLVVYAAKWNSTVPESEGRNSLFTGALLKYLRTPGLDATSVFRKVMDEVTKATQKKQTPTLYFSDQYDARFKFADATVGSTHPPEWFAEQAAKKAAEEKLGTVKLEANVYGEIFVDDQHTDNVIISGLKPGTHTVEMRYGYGIIDKKAVPVEAGKTTTVPFDRKERPKPRVSMVLVEGKLGQLRLPSTAGDKSATTTFTYRTSSFLIGKWEVTQGEWKEVMGTNPSSWISNEDWPVTDVSWNDAVKYCNARSLREGLAPYYTIDGRVVRCNLKNNGYRLPTEEEWEFAARGGNNSHDYRYAGGNDPGPLAWYSENSQSQPWVVGTKKSNELGICDMSGNVWEWCWDEVYPDGVYREPTGSSSDTHHVLRGGSWSNADSDIQVDSRYDEHPDYSGGTVGFRVARSPMN